MNDKSRYAAQPIRARFIRWSRALAGVVLVFAVYTASAATTNSGFAVSVIVMPRTAIVASSMPDALEVSADDVARGFVDVTGESRLVVTNSSPGGYELDVWPVGSVFSAVTVYGIGADVAIGADGGSLFLRGQHGAAIPLQLNYHFRLPVGTLPGRYPWPLQFSIHPILEFGG